jgi:hypothetical protein
MRNLSIRHFALASLLTTLTGVSGCVPALKQVASLSRPPSVDQKIQDQAKIIATSSKVDNSATLEQLGLYSANLLKKRKFEELRTKIDQARTTQERLPGGYWKLYALYEGLAAPNFGKNATASEWEEHIARLTDWKTEMPDSVSARIALADALVNYGWEARGTDFVNKISDESMRTFLSRVKMAEKELIEAKEFDTKCPRWYETMLSVGLALGFSRSKYDQIYEEGFQMTPTYYHLSRQKVTYLLPQWMGEPGDIAKFVNNVSDRIGGDEGAIIYCELAGTLWPEYHQMIWTKTGLSAKRSNAGYNALKGVYGVDGYRKNLRMALVMSGGDGSVDLDEVLQDVGNEWDEDVWGTRERFDEQKQMLRTAAENIKNLKKTHSQNIQPTVPPS